MKHNPRTSANLACHRFHYQKVTATNLPGSIPSVLGASKMGAKIVTFLTVTFLQSYGCSVQKGESRKVMLEITMSLDHIICTSGPLVLLRSFCRYFFHQACPCPLMVPLWPVGHQEHVCNQTMSTTRHFQSDHMHWCPIPRPLDLPTTWSSHQGVNLSGGSVAGLSIIYEDQWETNKQNVKMKVSKCGFEPKYSLRPTKLAHFESSNF